MPLGVKLGLFVADPSTSKAKVPDVEATSQMAKLVLAVPVRDTLREVTPAVLDRTYPQLKALLPESVIWQLFTPVGIIQVPPPETEERRPLLKFAASTYNRWPGPVDGMLNEHDGLQLMP